MIPASTSRSAVKFSVSDFAASLTGPDADLITLCDRLYTLRNAELALYEATEDDNEIEDALQPIDAEWWAVAASIYDHEPPRSLEGAKAMARAVIPHMYRDGDRAFYGTDIGEWMTVRVAEFLAGSRVA